MPRNDAALAANRRSFLKTAVCGGAAATLNPIYPALAAAREVVPAASAPQIKSFELEEITVAQLQDGMKSGKFTSRSLVEKYSARIDEIDKQGPSINAVIERNPDALSIAEALDQERRSKGSRGPMHGIPVLIKDNINTADKMMTTAGSLALLGSKPLQDSFVAQKLRAAGAVILGRLISASGPIFVPAIPPADGAGAEDSPKILTRSTAILADQVQVLAQASPRISLPWELAPKPMAQSSAHRPPTGSPELNPRSA